MSQVFNPSTWVTEAGTSLSWRPASSTEQVPGHRSYAGKPCPAKQQQQKELQFTLVPYKLTNLQVTCCEMLGSKEMRAIVQRDMKEK